MSSKINEDVSVTLTMHGITYSVIGLPWNINGDELKEVFTRLMVQASFPPTIIEPAEGGHYEYVED